MYKVLEAIGYEELMKKNHISSLAAKVMACRNIPFINDKNCEKDAYEYNNMDKVVSKILKCISDKKKIMVYGDYDVDGICSVSILYRTFCLLNYDIGYYIPSRYKDGYGITCEMVEEISKKDYSLIICVDNGIKAFEAIDLAKSKGIEVIVLDHHQKEDTYPNFDLYLHPEYSSFTNYNMCAASVCYFLSKALLAGNDYICTCLAGIATVGDVMPLIEQNKQLVINALNCLNKRKYKAIEALNSDNKKYDEVVLGMSIIPKLNSVGRICKGTNANKLVKFLTSENDIEIKELASFIERCNLDRKNMTEQAFKALDKNNYQKIIIEKSDDMLEGINGIIAARFSNKYHLPSIVFSLDETQEFYKGSARSIDGINIVELISKNEFVYAFGGHKGAAGLTIKKEDYDNFVNQITKECDNIVYEEEIIEVISIEKEELTFKAYQDLLKLGPFGEGNEKPLFIINNCDTKLFNKSKDGKHLLMNISNEAGIVGFNMGSSINNEIDSYNLVVKIEPNNMYQNKITCFCIEMEGNNNV